MCGIVGVVFRNPTRRVDVDRLIAARESLRHRGPDEAGLWRRPGAALAHRRLKVLDLAHGQQPMISDDERFALVYNGEVYNFRELQARYRQQGVHFHTRCDTEVVLHALRCDGPNAVQQFNGMFAIGLWDQVERSLLLVRDRLGQKPLYWFADEEQLVFASELKAILTYLEHRFELDPLALDEFFARGYILSPRTIFQGVHKLPAASMLQLDAARWQWNVKSYWDIAPQSVPADPGDAIDGLEELLQDAVKMRLVSDVPIGCLLSGGIDSSLITAMAAKVSSEPVKAFSIGFDESADLNELPFARIVAEHYGCQWFQRNVRGDDFTSTLYETAAFFDEPYGNFTMFSMRRLAQMARQELVVVLSGQGGDELTAGYPGRYNWIAATQVRADDRHHRSQYAAPVDDLVNHVNHSSFVPWTGGRDRIFSDAMRRRIAADAGPLRDMADVWRRHASLDRVNRVLYTDVKTNLPDYLVCLEDRMTMSHGLEARNPLLDYRVVNYLMSVPGAMKLRDGENKWLLKALALRHVPAEAIDRPKRGFTPPLGLWMQRSADRFAEIFRETEGQTAGLYAPAWRQYLTAGRYDQRSLMGVFYSLMFAVWTQQYGRYVANWPSPQTAGAPANGATWHAALRTQDGAAIARGRWFCQALNNFAPGARIRIEGDGDGWHAHLAASCGFTVADASTCEALILVGDLSLLESLDERLTADAWADAGELLLFLSFKAAEQTRLQTLLPAAAQILTIKGSQAAPLDEQQGILIVRAALRCGASEPIVALKRVAG